jgi:hypothetical protein
MQTSRFRWFILISFMIHTVLLWLFHFVPRYELKPSPPLEVELFTLPSSPQQKTLIQRSITGRATTRTAPLRDSTRTKPLSPPAKSPIPSWTGEPSSREIETAIAPGGRSSGTGIIAPGSEGIASGSGGAPSGTGETPSGTKGDPGPRGAPSGKKGSPGSERDAFSGVEIPGYVIDAAGFRSSHSDGGIYPEIDFYVLYGVDKQTGINVPGTEVCIEGEQLRTKERMTITEIKTDYSKCRFLETGDDSPPKIVCPAEAETRTVHFNHYASSPLVYSVRTCLEYDRSHCYDAAVGDEGEREVCRANFQYEGMWTEGTIFAYRCAKSEARTYRQPLQYNIRWIMEIEIDDRLRKRQIYRETRSVPPCN